MTKGFESYSVGRLREVMVQCGDFDEESAKTVTGKPNLVYEVIKLAEAMDVDVHTLLDGEANTDELEDLADIDFTDAEEVVDAVASPAYPEGHELDTMNGDDSPPSVDPNPTPVIPAYASPDWSDYVLEQFEERELMDGNPTVSGLRRVAELMLGEIVFSGPRSLDVFHPQEPGVIGRASCMYEVSIAWKHGIMPLMSDNDMNNYQLPHRTFGACAGSFLGNTDDTYAIYPEAMAETRAESRALRKALCLNNVVSHEELTGKDAILAVNMSRTRPDAVVDMANDWGGEEPISGIQKTHITVKAGQLGIDVDKFINLEFHEGRSEEKRYDSLEEVNKSTAAAMVKELTRYQSEAGAESRKIPNSILLETTDES